MKTTPKTSIFQSLLVCSLFLCATLGYAQIDAPRKSIKIDGKQPNQAETPILVSPENASSSVSSSTVSVKSKVRLGQPESGTKKKEVRFMEGEEFAKKDYTALENKMNNKTNHTKDAGLQPEFYNDQFLGDFRSGSKFVRFLYRDHQYVDGDRVSVSVNDTIIHPNIHLAGEFQGFYIDLKKGFNKIDITALNQGTSGPNTAQFVMYDDNRQVISSNVWNLATGVKATVIIVKDED
ncbi:hypothetical protein ACFO3O_19605 [Dokdonia ponticola]|uniref:Secreted protein n=1 Tax=Dokdonia ponticola TaxID=2041041 RepID=A0ABV9I119_9FLAO